MRIAHFGTFDVENFGDLLFPLLLERRLAGMGFEFVHVSPAGGPQVWRDCVRTVSTASVLDEPGGFAAAVVGGGNIVHAAPTTLDAYVRGDASHVTAYAALWMGAAYVAACNDAPLCWNAPSVAQPFSPQGAKLARWAASLVEYLAVRDPSSVAWLREAGVTRPVHVVPDTALELSAMWPRESLADEYAAAFARRGREVPGRSVCFHLNGRFIGADYDALAVRLDRITQRHGLTPVLVATGPCHGEAELARDVGRRMAAAPLVVDRPHSLREIAALLAHAEGYVGSSLHGMIVACSYGRRGMMVMPRVNAPVARVTGFVDTYGLSRWLVPTWEDAEREAGDFFAAPAAQWEWPLVAGGPLLEEHWARVRAALAPAEGRKRGKRAALEKLPAVAGGGAAALLCGAVLADHAARGLDASRGLGAERGRTAALAAANEALRALATGHEQAAAREREAGLAAAARLDDLSRAARERDEQEAALRRGLADAAARAAEPQAALGEAEAREYALHLDRVRQVALQVVPEGATVAVVSKGDDDLLRVPGRRCSHFPADAAGAYAGHPADGAEAVAQVKAARERGVQFLLFPRDASWWLEHYRGLREHLRQYSLAHRDGNAVIYSLAPAAGAAPLPPPDPAADKEAEYRGLVRRLREVVRAVVPADATVLVVSKGDDALLALGGRRAWHFPREPGGAYAGHHPRDGADAIEHLERTRPRRNAYLLVPGPYLWWLDHYADFARHLEANYEAVWRDEGCVLFALRRKDAAAAVRQWAGRLWRRVRPKSKEFVSVAHEAAAAPDGPKRPEDVLRASLVTVVVPVYNAYEQTRACLASLVRHGRSPHRVLLIDDRSTDGRVWPLLRAYAAAHEHVVAVRNERNLGFTATVNRGCALAPGDVVLLNSDTEVTADWLEKLSACAASAENVATVTALSNAAGAFSLPVNNADNEIPPPLTADDVAAAVERLSQWVRPEVPTGNGFCMYVTRRALARVGAFDEENFPRGYGEENDFCRRCAAAGMVNLIDDRTFVRHEGTASFLGSKAAHVARGLAAMRRLHPGYDALVQGWLRDDPLDGLRAAVRDALNGAGDAPPPRADRPCVLFVVHDGGGGTILMAEDLAAGLRASFRCLLLKTGADDWTLHENSPRGMAASRRYHFTSPWRADAPLDAERVGVLRALLRDGRVDLVHAHHLLFNGPEVIRVAKAAGLPVSFSFHDFYTVCPGAYLGAHAGDGPDVRDALEAWVGGGGGSNGSRGDRYSDLRGATAAALEACDAFVAPTRSTLEVIGRRLKFLGGRDVRVIEHGRDLPRASLAVRPRPGAAARVVCLGNLDRVKGTELIAAVMRRDAERGRRFEFHFLGLKEPGFTPEEWGGVYHGAYDRDGLEALLRRIGPSFSMIASVWETYCYTLTESWALGLPVFASDVGALGERVRRHGGGWLLDPRDPERWYEGMVRVLDSPADYDEQAGAVRSIPIKGVAEMAADYEDLFASALPRATARPGAGGWSGRVAGVAGNGGGGRHG